MAHQSPSPQLTDSIPSSLSPSHLEQLQQPGASLNFTDGEYRLTVTPPPYQTLCRIWDPQSPEPNEESGAQKFHLGTDDVYKVHAKLEWETCGTGTGAGTTGGYLLAPVQMPGITSYFWLDSLENRGNMNLSANFSGPAAHLSDLRPDKHQHLASQTVTIGFASKPLSLDLVAPPLPEVSRGYSDMPDKADRIIMFDPSSHPTLAAEWERVLWPIGQEVDKITTPNTGTGVHLMTRELYRPHTGQSLNCMVICMIIVKPALDASIRNCIYRIQNILCAHGYYDIGILISVEEVISASSDDKSLQTSLQPQLSASIGPAGKIGGTGGGYVTLFENGIPRPGLYIMTAHHVVCDGRKPVQSASWSSMNKIEGPTRKLIAEAKNETKLKLKDAEEELRQAKEINIKAHQARHVQAAEDVIAELNSESENLVAAEKFHDLGEVFASSGLVTIPTHIAHGEPFDKYPWESDMDWALVEVNKDRIQRSPYNVSSIELRHRNFKFTDKCIKTGKLSFGSLRPAIDKGALKMPVVHIDRVQQVHYGQVDPCRCRVVLAGATYPALAYSVSPEPNNTGAVFGSRGDSGAWVMDGNGNVNGLLYAVSDKNTRSYVIDMNEIIQDIKTRTGKDVRIADQ